MWSQQQLDHRDRNYLQNQNRTNSELSPLSTFKEQFYTFLVEANWTAIGATFSQSQSITIPFEFGMKSHHNKGVTQDERSKVCEMSHPVSRLNPLSISLGAAQLGRLDKIISATCIFSLSSLMGHPGQNQSAYQLQISLLHSVSALPVLFFFSLFWVIFDQFCFSTFEFWFYLWRPWIMTPKRTSRLDSQKAGTSSSNNPRTGNGSNFQHF